MSRHCLASFLSHSRAPGGGWWTRLRSATPTPAWAAARDRCTPRGAAAAAGASPAAGPGDPAPADDDVPPRGCGWFDSSLDLQRGLQVQEHAGVDRLAEALPAAHWLAFELGVAPGGGCGRPK